MAGLGREYLLAPSMHLGDEIVLEQRDRQPAASKLTFQRADAQPFALVDDFRKLPWAGRGHPNSGRSR